MFGGEIEESRTGMSWFAWVVVSDSDNLLSNESIGERVMDSRGD